MRQPLKFGRYTLHFNPKRVYEDQRLIKFSPRQLAVLTSLLRARGKVVSKEELLVKVWADVIVEEANLTQAIFLIRKVLGKLAEGGEYIENVPTKGYRIASLALASGVNALSFGKRQAGLPGSFNEGEQFRLLVNAVEDYAIYMLDCAGRVLTWNSGAAKHKGYTAQEIIGQHFSRFFIPEDVDAEIPDRELSLAKRKGSCAGEGWRLRKNGDRFWASFVLTAVHSSAGKLVGFAKIVRDLTEQKRREDALLGVDAMLRRERDRLNAAVESSMDAFSICEALRDREGLVEDFIFTYLNSNVEKMVSIPRGEMLGGKMCLLLPANLSLGLFEKYKQVLETGEPYVAEFAISEENVTSEWLRVQAVRLQDGVAITASDITERKRSERQVRYMAEHDHLTGLLNRSVLLPRLDGIVQRALCQGARLAVIFVDVDDFKEINDRHGHVVGDQVLTCLAARITHAVRSQDLVFRVGGDEFLIILAGVGLDYSAEECSKTILKSIQMPMQIQETRLQVTCSIGVTVVSEDKHDSVDLLHTADTAMYAAKRAGKNGIHIAA